MPGGEISTLKVGLTGPIGSGKSYVANKLRDAGFCVYDSDREAKCLTESNADVRRSIVALLGPEAYDSQGAYQRQWVASRAFQNRTLLQGLNDIIHPAVFHDFAVWANLRQAEGERIVFFESALLPSIRHEYLEALDRVVLVHAERECRMRRAMARDAATREAIMHRMENQPSDEAYAAIADYTLHNDGNQQLESQLKSLFKQLKAR